MAHPTQIFLANPQALRIEYRLDDQQLELWWSPKAGESTDCADRNYSARDAHLNVFERIEFPGCDRESFQSCDYDPYHSTLRFASQSLHLAVAVDAPIVFLWCEHPQAVDFKTARFDEALIEAPDAFAVKHAEPRYDFEFAAQLGAGEGALRHCHFHGPESPRFVRAELAAGQMLAIGAGVAGEEIAERLRRFASQSPQERRAEVEAVLQPVEAAGHAVSPAYPDLEALRKKTVRGLHSMIDESGAYRASLKAIYYLIWIRDSGFSFAYQAAAGWPHKLGELGRLLLDNPCTVRDEGLPNQRMFAQLVNCDYGKLEEDGLYYVVWTLFTHWTQVGCLDFMTEADWALIDEALDWVEQVTWDPERGLFGEHFADETPTQNWRDFGWDYAIGKPLEGADVMRHHPGDAVTPEQQDSAGAGQPIERNYDVYFQMIMHSTYVMLSAMTEKAEYARKAERLWPQLKRLLNERHDGVPVYGELLLEGGSRVLSPHWGEARSCCIWGLTMPNFAPLEDWDAVLGATMDAIAANPEMHWINGIAAAMAAVDPWCYDEQKLLALHQRLATETNTPGEYLPMGGAMPEKFNAPPGNLYHDIRPQGFAMGAWLAAWSSLGLRRLPYGLALRPTQAFTEIQNYAWRGQSIQFHFGPTGKALALEVEGRVIPGSLQVPEGALHDDAPAVKLVAAEARPLWLRSTVRLNEVEAAAEAIHYHGEAFGLSEITFSEPVGQPALTSESGAAIEATWVTNEYGMATAYFDHTGPFELRLG